MSYVKKANEYIEGVLNGDILACKWVKLACERQKNDLKRAKKVWKYGFDEGKAERICQFVELMPHIKGDWARAKLVNGVLTYPKIELEGWQCFLWMQAGRMLLVQCVWQLYLL